MRFPSVLWQSIEASIPVALHRRMVSLAGRQHWNEKIRIINRVKIDFGSFLFFRLTCASPINAETTKPAKATIAISMYG